MRKYWKIEPKTKKFSLCFPVLKLLFSWWRKNKKKKKKTAWKYRTFWINFQRNRSAFHWFDFVRSRAIVVVSALPLELSGVALSYRDAHLTHQSLQLVRRLKYLSDKTCWDKLIIPHFWEIYEVSLSLHEEKMLSPFPPKSMLVPLWRWSMISKETSVEINIAWGVWWRRGRRVSWFR